MFCRLTIFIIGYSERALRENHILQQTKLRPGLGIGNGTAFA
jgi:hypothetical protein